MEWPTRVAMLVLCAVGVTAAPVRAANDPELKKSITHLFEVGWGTSLDARKAADAAHAEMSATDARANYAYVLVLLKQGRYTEAGHELSGLLGKQQDDEHLWRGRAWLLMLQKKYAAALLDMEKLAELVAATNGESGRAEKNQDLARFLGRMYGFLEGPGAGQMGAPEREKSRRKVTDTLPESLRPLFDDAAADVLAQYKALTTEKKVTQGKIQADAETEREKLLADLDKEEDRIAARRESLEPQRDKMRNDLKSELSGLDAKDQPLAEALAAAVSRANSISNEMNLLQSDMNRYRALAAAEKDPARRQSYLQQVDNLRLFGLRYSNDLADVQARMDEINARRTALRAKAADVQARYGNLQKDVDGELADLDAQQKKIQAQRGQKRPAATNTARVGALSAQAQALTTYDTFPLEAEKQRLLASFAP